MVLGVFSISLARSLYWRCSFFPYSCLCHHASVCYYALNIYRAMKFIQDERISPFLFPSISLSLSLFFFEGRIFSHLPVRFPFSYFYFLPFSCFYRVRHVQWPCLMLKLGKNKNWKKKERKKKSWDSFSSTSFFFFFLLFLILILWSSRNYYFYVFGMWNLQKA